MKIRILLLLCGLALCGKAQTVNTLNGRPLVVEKWVKQHFGKGEVPPFSFTYGGRPSASFIRSWKYSVKALPSEEEGVVRRRYAYEDPKTGLCVNCDVTMYTNFEAVEWVLRFHNTGKENSLPITQVLENNLTLRSAGAESFRVRYSIGSIATRQDFEPYEKNMTTGDTLRLRTAEGRSSVLNLPFFNVEDVKGHEGYVVAIGWSGMWKADLIQRDARSLQVQSGLANFDAYLRPDEEVRTASVCLLHWQGDDTYTGHNRLRRLILAHHTRKVGGKAAIYPTFFGFNWGDPAPCNEYSCLTTKMALALLERQQLFGLSAEASWLDAGWYVGADDYEHGKNWANTVGNWEVNRNHFPNGLREISDELHRMGRKFMVWFEPERVHPDTKWYNEHADWLLNGYLFNLSNPEARAWLCQTIGDIIEKEGIDIYRQDFNCSPEDAWKGADEEGRKGITETKYIEGLYEYWDYLLHRFPELLIDNCASGGRRLDWETTLRSAPMWRTDDCYYNDPSDMQCHGYGINLYLPQTATGVGNPNKTDKYSLRSSFASATVYNWKITHFDESFLEMQKCQKEFNAVRPYFLEDYYPLSGTAGVSAAQDNWLAYQLHRPSDNTGYVVAFRHKDCANAKTTVSLHALPEGTYQLTDQDSGRVWETTATELSNGLPLELEQPETSLLIYYAPLQ